MTTLSAAGDQARRGRHLGRPADAGLGGLGAGDRAQAAGLRHLRPARLAPFAVVRICRRQGDRDHPRAAGEGRGRPPLSAAAYAHAEDRSRALRDKNLRPRDGKPFSDYSINERYRHVSDAADEIAEIAGQIAGRRSVPPPEPISPAPQSSPPIASMAPREVATRIRTSTLSPQPLVDGRRETEPEINDKESLKRWLDGANTRSRSRNRSAGGVASLASCTRGERAAEPSGDA